MKLFLGAQEPKSGLGRLILSFDITHN